MLANGVQCTRFALTNNKCGGIACYECLETPSAVRLLPLVQVEEGEVQEVTAAEADDFTAKTGTAHRVPRSTAVVRLATTKCRQTSASPRAIAWYLGVMTNELCLLVVI